MDIFVWIIVILLVLAILNNVIMYYKYKLYNRLPNTSVALYNDDRLDVANIKIYSKKKQYIKSDIDMMLKNLNIKYSSDIVIIDDNTASDPSIIDKINLIMTN